MGTRTTSVMELLNRIRDGDQLVLPDIQREFVWREEQIRLLMDSLMRGYPFGALLVWQTQFVAVPFRPFVRDFQPGMTFVTSEKPAKQKMEMVLDGQQRLQSLYLAAFGSYAGRHLYFNITSGSEGAADDADSEGARFRFEFWRMDETNRPKRLLRVADALKAPRRVRRATIFAPFIGSSRSRISSPSRPSTSMRTTPRMRAPSTRWSRSSCV